MDFESQQMMAVLGTENEYNDMNIEDSHIEKSVEVEAPQESDVTKPTLTPFKRLNTKPTQALRKRRRTSAVWKDFITTGIEKDGKERAKCIHCGIKLVIYSETRDRYGTNHLMHHLEVCSKMPKKEHKPTYDQKVDREMVSEIIIYHDLPFKYVEYEKVRARDKYLNPDVKHICRQKAGADVFKRYIIEKEKLKEELGKHRGRVCFTSNLWSSRTTVMSYICLIVHYIDDKWNLNSKILTFCELKSPHTSEEIANKVLECLNEWNLEKKIFSITLDNAIDNDSIQKILRGRFQRMSGSGLLCDGKFMHVRCSAHIFNLIVKEGLELARNLLHAIRESVRYVNTSQQRMQAFASCVERVGIRSGADLSLDVPTRWNSTYEMLVRALKFRESFKSMEFFDTNYKSLPSEDEWNRGEKICELLKPFSVITSHFSGSKYPTSNVYFTQVWRIYLLLKKYATCDDDALKKMACDMKIKFTKYWEDNSLILAMGVVLDPRMKLQMLEKAYERVDPSTSKWKIEELRKNLTMLYRDYQSKRLTSSSGVSSTPTPNELVSESLLEDDLDKDLFELEKSIESCVSSTNMHLDIYLNEPRLERKSFPNLDVLGYWRDNQHRLGDLASMACDVLSIPITTIASESAFKIGSRVLTPYRNRLLPKNVQALLCTRNWLHGFAEYEGTIEDDNNIVNEDNLELAYSKSED